MTEDDIEFYDCEPMYEEATSIQDDSDSGYNTAEDESQ